MIYTAPGEAWNQALFAAPMIALYVLSIAIAWAVAPRTDVGA
jgi:Sec-independent protein secretion pathway component TatC